MRDAVVWIVGYWEWAGRGGACEVPAGMEEKGNMLRSTNGHIRSGSGSISMLCKGEIVYM